MSAFHAESLSVQSSQFSELAPCRVTLEMDGRFTVLSEGGSAIRAMRADSCLLVPEPGDLVLVFRRSKGQNYILSVLEKTSQTGAVALPTRARLQGEEIELAAGKRLGLSAPELGIAANIANLGVVRLTLACRKVFGNLSEVSLNLDRLSTSIGRIIQNITDSFRRVSGVESVHAESLRFQAREGLDMRCEDATIKARREVVVDGERIKLG